MKLWYTTIVLAFTSKQPLNEEASYKKCTINSNRTAASVLVLLTGIKTTCMCIKSGGCTKTAVIYYTNIIGQHFHHVKFYKNCTTIVAGVAAAVLVVVSYCLIVRNIIRIQYQ